MGEVFFQDEKEGEKAVGTDDELYLRFLGGDTGAYDDLLIRYGDNLTFYLNGYLHNLQDSEDLMIEAFARIMAKKPSIGEGNFKAYLFRTGRNLASRFHSLFSRLKEFSLDDMVIEPADGYSMKNELQSDERKRGLHACLNRIDPDLREALWLIYFEDMSYSEAAQVMGVNPKRVDHLLTRGKKQLSLELKKEGITNAYE